MNKQIGNPIHHSNLEIGKQYFLKTRNGDALVEMETIPGEPNGVYGFRIIRGQVGSKKTGEAATMNTMLVAMANWYEPVEG